MSSPSEPTPSRSISPLGQWIIVLLLMGFTSFGHFNRNSISVVGTETFIKNDTDAQNLIQANPDKKPEELNLPVERFSPDQMGWIYASLLIVYTTCMIPGGWVIDRFGPKATLAMMGFGSACLVAMTGLIGLIPGLFAFNSFIVVRGILGGVYAPLHPACARMVSLTIPRRNQALANGLVTGAALAGIASIYLAFGFLVDKFAWTGAFLVASLFTLGLTLLWLFVPTQHTRHPALSHSTVDPHPTGLGSFLGLLSNKRLLLLSLSYAGYSYFQYLFFYWMQFYFSDTLKLGKDDSRFYSTIPLIAMAISMPLGGWIADTLAKRNFHPGLVPMVSLIASAALGYLGTLLTDALPVSICFSLALGIMGFCEGPYWTLGVAIGRRSGGMSGAILNTIGNVGGILSTVITPYLSGMIGGRGSFAVASLTCIIGALLWIPLRHNPDE